MMRAGSLDRQIQILKPVVEVDEFGDEQEVWPPLLTIWANKLEIGAIDLLRNPQIRAEQKTVFTIRDPGVQIDTGMRIKDDAKRLYEIAAIGELPGRRRGFQIQARGLDRLATTVE
jgi:head-tail adaptor